MSMVMTGAILFGLLMVGQPGSMGTVRVAVVNVGLVSERYARTADLEAEFEQRRVKLNQRREEMQKDIERMRQSLAEELKPDTTVYNERRKQLAMKEAELQWFMDSESQLIERALGQSLRAIYDDIREVVSVTAEELKIEMVLSVDELPKAPPVNPSQARQQIVLQKVLYWHPRIDLTEDIVTRLNKRYEASKSTPAAPSGHSP